LGYCAGLGEAAGFGETTLGPLPGIPHPVIPPEWGIGSHQEVGWNAFANHGGGYLYMLCKKTDYDDCRDAHLPSGPSQADQEQTDAYLRCVWDCFESMTLEWVLDTQKVQYQDDACTYASTKALTKFGKNGHSWRYTPIPDYLQVTLGGEGICTWEHVTGFSNTKAEAEFIESFGTSDVCDTGPHAHNPKEWQIMDQIRVPTNIPDGEYLLSWRWDAYMADQMWTNCADVQIISNSGTRDGSISSKPDCIPGQMPPSTPATPAPALPPSTPATPTPALPPSQTPACMDLDLPGNWGAGGTYSCDYYQEHGGEAYCAHVDIDDNCCFCGGGATGSASVAPTPTQTAGPISVAPTTMTGCTDLDLPGNWGAGGIYGCDHYQEHGGEAYCARVVIGDNCCFCGGGSQSN